MRENTTYEQLLNNPDVTSFHRQFETHFEIKATARIQFGNDVLLQALRQAYVFEVYAQSTGEFHEKILYLHDALDTLASLDDRTHTAAELLFLCHYRAKLQYQLGVFWMEMQYAQAGHIDCSQLLQAPAAQLNARHHAQLTALQNSKQTPLQLAILAFSTAQASYQAFEHRYPIAAADFCQQSYQLHPTFAVFDPYSPWARLISIGCNLYLCVQEDDTSMLSDAELLHNLNTRIAQHREKKGSVSHQAIMTVCAILQQAVTAPAPLPDNPAHIRKKSRVATPRANKTTTPMPHAWLPTITNRAAFNASLAPPHGLIPSFLRPRQQQDLQQIYAALSTVNRPLVVTKPTGTGKTAEFSALTSAAWHQGVATIIVVPTATLAEQTRNKLLEYGAHEGMDYAVEHIGLFCPTKHSLQIAPITVITQASYVRKTAEAMEKFGTAEALATYLATHPQASLEKEVFFHPAFFSLLIVDEGHHVVGEKMYEVVKQSQCERPIILFSASTLPGEYSEIDRIGEHVITQTLRSAIEDGELAALQTLMIDFSMYPEAKALTRSIRQHMQGKAELDAESRQEIADLMCLKQGFSLTALSILKQISEKIPTTKKMMVFTDSTDHADILANLLSRLFAQDIRAFHTKAANRDEILSNFRTNRSPVIVAVGTLDEGFDDPNINVILDFSIHVSRIRRIMQRLGRALRLREDGSGAILISIKLLPQDLQLIPRDVIMGHHEHGFLGISDPSQILNESMIQLTLPEPLTVSAAGHTLTIIPQSAAIVFPMGRKRIKLGTPPAEGTEEEAPQLDHGNTTVLANSKGLPAQNMLFFSTESAAAPHVFLPAVPTQQADNFFAAATAAGEENCLDETDWGFDCMDDEAFDKLYMLL